MKVLFVGPLPEPVTGHSLACQVFLDALIERHSVEVVNLNKGEFRQGISSIRRIFEVLGVVWRVCRRHTYADVIYFTISESIAGNIKDLLIYMACFTRLRRVAIHLHGGAGMREIMSSKRPVLRRMNGFFLRRLGAVIVLGPRHVEIFDGVVAREKIHVVPNFAQDELFSDPDAIDRKFRRPRPLRILFLSNLLPGKGHIELADALRTLDASVRSTVEADFAGGFESERQKQDFLAQIRDISQARYHGSVRGEAKIQLFSRAHVFCLPTYYPYEGQPISILEAYASGCAVITTDHSGIFDIFSDRVKGYAVAKRSAEALKSAIEAALAAPDELHRMAKENFQTAQRRYRTANHTRALIDIISNVHAQQP